MKYAVSIERILRFASSNTLRFSLSGSTWYLLGASVPPYMMSLKAKFSHFLSTSMGPSALLRFARQYHWPYMDSGKVNVGGACGARSPMI